MDVHVTCRILVSGIIESAACLFAMLAPAFDFTMLLLKHIGLLIIRDQLGLPLVKLA